MPDEREALGLHALLLTHDARRDARVDAAGALVLLEDQDRARWDNAAIEQATGWPRARCASAPGPLRAPGRDRRRARHAPRAQSWDRDALRPHLAALAPTRSWSSTAPSRSRSPATSNGGLARIDALGPTLDRYHYFHAARADLLRRLGEREPAARAYDRALALAGNAAERAFLRRRLGLEGGDHSPPSTDGYRDCL